MSSRFNVGWAVAFVLAGTAALLLATVLAVGGYGRTKPPATPTVPAAASSAPDTEGEYLLDVPDPPSTAEPAPGDR